tara:strand:+ start:231 stop:452 length:222 start_codon:yes stop_codon:yes gene_type:complete
MDKQSQLNKNLLENNLNVYEKLEKVENDIKNIQNKTYKLKSNGLISGDLYDFITYEHIGKNLEELLQEKKEKK